MDKVVTFIKPANKRGFKVTKSLSKKELLQLTGNSKVVIRKLTRTKIKASGSTILNIYNDKVYLTSVPIEECPRCVTVLVPEQFTVNVVTAVMKTTCHCGMSIEIDPMLSFCTTKSDS